MPDESSSPQIVPGTGVWTWPIILLVLVNILFLGLIGAGLFLVLPPVFHGLQHYLDGLFR